MMTNQPPGAQDTAVVTLTITPINDPPMAMNDSYTTTEDAPLMVAAPGVLGNDLDIDPTLIETGKVIVDDGL